MLEYIDTLAESHEVRGRDLRRNRDLHLLRYRTSGVGSIAFRSRRPAAHAQCSGEEPWWLVVDEIFAIEVPNLSAVLTAEFTEWGR